MRGRTSHLNQVEAGVWKCETTLNLLKAKGFSGEM